jgi:23S rRNA (guanosine2251-2'-O)-methyltransferase
VQKSDFIFGIHPVIEAIQAGKEIEKLLIRKGASGSGTAELMRECREAGVNFQFVPVEKLNRITTKNHQGVVAFLSPIEYNNIHHILTNVFEKGETPFILILDGITDVRNFGAICRSAECAGVHAVVVPDKGSALITSEAIKTSAGALSFIPVCRVKNMKELVVYLKESGLQIYAATEKAQEIYFQQDYTSPLAIISGAEDVGISPELIRLSDKLIRIPLKGRIDSLNVSAATSVVLFEVVKQRNA